jgi:hypothetical protein
MNVRKAVTITASVDYGSGRPAEGDATRSHTAMRGNCTTEHEPGNADYFMLVQPRESLDLFGRSPGVLGRRAER